MITDGEETSPRAAKQSRAIAESLLRHGVSNGQNIHDYSAASFQNSGRTGKNGGGNSSPTSVRERLTAEGYTLNSVYKKEQILIMAKYHEIPEVDKLVKEMVGSGRKCSENPEENLALITLICESQYEDQTGKKVPTRPFLPESAKARGARFPLNLSTGFIKLYEARDKMEQAEASNLILQCNKC